MTILRLPGKRWRFSPAKAQSLRMAPQDLRTADPTRASEIYSGRFAFAGKVVVCDGRSPFEMEPPSDEWAEVLLAFLPFASDMMVVDEICKTLGAVAVQNGKVEPVIVKSLEDPIAVKRGKGIRIARAINVADFDEADADIDRDAYEIRVVLERSDE